MMWYPFQRGGEEVASMSNIRYRYRLNFER